VEIDNAADEACTVVRVTAPNRVRLLADFAAALSGLGLSIVQARIATVGGSIATAPRTQHHPLDAHLIP
jgi:UTP:GlnB (protein PII) uridylyltransferase